MSPHSADLLTTLDMFGFTVLHITDCTDQRNIQYLSLSGGTTLKTRGKFQGAYKLPAGHHTVIWLLRGMKSTKTLFACAGVGHMQRSLIAWDIVGN